MRTVRETLRVVPLACLLLLVTCETEERPAPLSSGDCDRLLLKLRGWIRGLTTEHQHSMVPVGGNLRLAVADIENAMRPTATGPLVEIERDRLLVEGESLSLDGAAGTRLLARFREMLAGSDHLKKLREPGRRQPALLVAIDLGAPWKHLVRVHDAAARAGFEQIAILFRPYGEKTVPRPGASPIDAELDEVRDIRDPLRKVPRLARLARRVCRGCEPLDHVFRSLSVTDPATRSKVLNQRLPDAVGRCRCAVDMPSLKALLWTLFERTALIAAWFDISARPVEKERAVAQAPDTPWSESHPAVISLARPGFSPRVRFQSE